MPSPENFNASLVASSPDGERCNQAMRRGQDPRSLMVLRAYPSEFEMPHPDFYALDVIPYGFCAAPNFISLLYLYACMHIVSVGIARISTDERWVGARHETRLGKPCV